MKRSDIEQLVSQEVETIIAGTDLELVDVEYVRERDWYLRVFIDKEGGVGLEDCQAVSEKLSEFLDVDVHFFTPYKGVKSLTARLVGKDESGVVHLLIDEEDAAIDSKDISQIRLHIDF